MKTFLTAGAAPLLAACLVAGTATAGEHDYHHHHHRDTGAVPGHHAHIPAPAGVMGAHLHEQGKWMLSYYVDSISQSGLRNGSDGVSAASVLATYLEAPLEMDMRMHMLEGMYGLTDNLTLMVMGHYMEMDMLHKAHGMHGHEHEMTKKGWGDTEVTALWGLWQSHGEISHSLLLNAGASLPTGSISEDFENHHNNVYHLPYNMQFGSGTFDPILGLTYSGGAGKWGWGAQTLNTFRLYDNSNDYHLGNEYVLNLWGSRQVHENAAVSLRLEGRHWGNIDGMDPDMPVTSMAGADPDGHGGEIVNAYVGLNLFDSSGNLQNHQLDLEFGLPLYEHFDGPQLEADYRFVLGYRYTF